MVQQHLSISSFNQFTLKILLPLLCIVAVIGYVFSYFFEQKIIFSSQIGGAYKVNRLMNEIHENEIPIFGSSSAIMNYIPDSISNDCFDYGLHGSRFNVTEFCLEQECKKKKKTPYIIISFDFEGLACGMGNIANYIPFAYDKGIREILGKNNHFNFKIPFIKYFGFYEEYLHDYFNNKTNITIISNKGAIFDKINPSKQKFDDNVEIRKHLKNFFYVDSSLYKKLINILTKNQDRYFIFVINPYHSSYFEAYENANVGYAFLSYLRTMPNVQVLDFSKIHFDDSLLYNTTHLNFQGAKVFNHMLKDSLQKIYTTNQKQ